MLMLENVHVSLSDTNFLAYGDISLPNLSFIELSLLSQQKKEIIKHVALLHFICFLCR